MVALIRALVLLNLGLLAFCLAQVSEPQGWTRRGLAGLDPTRNHVLVVGDSIASGHSNDPRNAFPAVLGRNLGIPVVNGSRGG